MDNQESNSIDKPTYTQHELRGVYDNMKFRCYNKNAINYLRYGGRGITVCDRWLGKDGFKNFVQDMGQRPEGKYESGLPKYSIDRIDNNKGYSPENCRWATTTQQSINRKPALALNIYYNKRKPMKIKDSLMERINLIKGVTEHIQKVY